MGARESQVKVSGEKGGRSRDDFEEWISGAVDGQRDKVSKVTSMNRWMYRHPFKGAAILLSVALTLYGGGIGVGKLKSMYDSAYSEPVSQTIKGDDIDGFKGDEIHRRIVDLEAKVHERDVKIAQLNIELKKDVRIDSRQSSELVFTPKTDVASSPSTKPPVMCSDAKFTCLILDGMLLLIKGVLYLAVIAVPVSMILGIFYD